VKALKEEKSKLLVLDSSEVSWPVKLPAEAKQVTVIICEKKEVGIEHISDPQEVDFLYNHAYQELKPTRKLSKNAQIKITYSS
jgi:hypothetical protein